jgi:hypothetical protein
MTVETDRQYGNPWLGLVVRVTLATSQPAAGAAHVTETQGSCQR